MKPVKILLFLLWVYLSLSVLAYIFPEKGIEINHQLKFKFPSIKNIIFPETTHYSDITNIIKNIDTVGTRIDIFPSEIDTNLSAEMRAKLHRIQFPNNDRSVLFQFLEALYQLKNEPELVRIIHYGDSQLEGDRMTGTIRYNLQTLFGGSGPGLLSVVDVAPTLSIHKTHSPNWSRYTVFGRRDTTQTGRQFGPMLSFCRFSTDTHDSASFDSASTSAWIKLSPSGNAYSRTRNYNQLSLFLGKCKRPLIIEIIENGQKLAVDTFQPFFELKKLRYQLNGNGSEIMVYFRSAVSPVVFALSLDNETGVAVDNIPIRGSSGVDFNKTDLNQLSRFYQNEKVRLLILQFGVNVAPNIVSNYNFYEEWLYKNLINLKNANPEMSIIVVGISDMSRKNPDGEGYESMPNIEKIRNAQRNAAFRAGCGFWDTYEAMGGKNSMPSWVFAHPPLAGKDFTHFNPEGARIIAQMFVNALLAEYEDYLSGRKSVISFKKDSLNLKNGKNN